MPRHRSAASARSTHMRSSHTMRGVWQRHGGAMRISDRRLGRIMRQSGRRCVHADIVALRERRHPHVRGTTERFLVRIQRFRQLRPREFPPDHHGRLVRILENHSWTSLSNHVDVVRVNVRVDARVRTRVYTRVRC